MEEKSTPTVDIRYIALGAIAAFLYGTTVLVPFFAAPLQTAWTRGGFKAFLTSFAVAFVCVTGWMLYQMRGVPSFGFTSFLLFLSLPIGLAAAVVFINSPWVSHWSMVYRTMAGGVLVAVIVAPSILSMFNDPDVEAYLRKGIEEISKTMQTAEGGGFASAVAKSSLDPDVLLGATRRIIADTFAALFFVITFLGHWIGTRMAGKDAPGADAVPKLHEFSVPMDMIWAFLGLWSLVLLTRLPALQNLHSLRIIEGIAWNFAIIVSFCYLVQGLGIIQHLLGRFAPVGPLRWTGILLVVLLLFNTMTGAWTAGIITVLGATETWVPYRISKGVQT